MFSFSSAATATGASQPSHSLAQSDSGYGSQLNLLSQQSGAAIADEDADTASYKLTPQLSVEPPKDGHFNGIVLCITIMYKVMYKHTRSCRHDKSATYAVSTISP